MSLSPRVDKILETSLYVDDLQRAVEFYRQLFGFELLFADERMCALDVSSAQVLLLFARGASTEPTAVAGGTIPGHDARGPQHLAFSIPGSALESWRSKLEQEGVRVDSEVGWPRGGSSVYFSDPDGHVIELVTPGCWTTY